MDQKRLGSYLIWPREGPVSGVLAPGAKHLDPDKWVRENWREWWPWWHSSQIVGYDDFEGFIVDEVLSGEREHWEKQGAVWVPVGYRNSGDRRIPLRRLIAERDGQQPLVMNWFTEALTADCCDRFLAKYDCVGYGSLDYVTAGASRKTRGRFPRIVNNRQYCWERSSMLADHAGDPWMPHNEMPIIMVLFKEYALREAAKWLPRNP